MTSRRAVLAGGAAAAGGVLLGQAAEAQKYVSPNTVGLSSLAGNLIRGALTKGEKVAVLGYRLGVVTRSGISASTGQGAVTMQTAVDLRGVTLAQTRAIADAAYADFITRLAATGRPMIGLEEVRATAAYKLIKPTPVPFTKKPLADARLVSLVAPNGQDMILQYLDSPLTDKSPFDQATAKGVNAISKELGGAVVLMPTVVVDFTELTGSGHRVYGSGASLSVKPGIYVVDMFTALGASWQLSPTKVDVGRAPLQARIPVGQAGQFIKTSDYNNRAEIEWWNMTASTATSDVGRPTLAYSYATYSYQVDPRAFHEVVLDGCRAMNRVYAEAVATYRFKP